MIAVRAMIVNEKPNSGKPKIKFICVDMHR